MVSKVVKSYIVLVSEIPLHDFCYAYLEIHLFVLSFIVKNKGY